MWFLDPPMAPPRRELDTVDGWVTRPRVCWTRPFGRHLDPETQTATERESEREAAVLFVLDVRGAGKNIVCYNDAKMSFLYFCILNQTDTKQDRRGINVPLR